MGQTLLLAAFQGRIALALLANSRRLSRTQQNLPRNSARQWRRFRSPGAYLKSSCPAARTVAEAMRIISRASALGEFCARSATCSPAVAYCQPPRPASSRATYTARYQHACLNYNKLFLRLSVPAFLFVPAVQALQHCTVFLLYTVASVFAAILTAPIWRVNNRKIKSSIWQRRHIGHAICV